MLGRRVVRLAARRGVDWLDWPCGQNPGRKPEGHQRALAREADESRRTGFDLQGQDSFRTAQANLNFDCLCVLSRMAKRAERASSRPDGRPHGEDPQVARARQEALNRSRGRL